MWTYLPGTNVFNPLSEWSSQVSAQFESIAPDLDNVVKKSTQGCEWEGGGEQNHITELYEHLQVIFKCVLWENKVESRGYIERVRLLAVQAENETRANEQLRMSKREIKHNDPEAKLQLASNWITRALA